MQRNNYERAIEQGRVLFQKADQERAIKGYGLQYDGAYLYMPMLCCMYRISRTSGVVEYQSGADSWEKAGHNEAMTLYDVLGYGDPDAKASGEYINLDSLVHTISAAGNPGDGFFAREAKKFEGHVEDLRRACESLEGTPCGKGDVAYQMPLFTFMDCRITFYDADDEFPGTLTIFFDTNILKFMHFETTWYAAGVIVSRLAEEAGIEL